MNTVGGHGNFVLILLYWLVVLVRWRLWFKRHFLPSRIHAFTISPALCWSVC